MGCGDGSGGRGRGVGEGNWGFFSIVIVGIGMRMGGMRVSAVGVGVIVLGSVGVVVFGGVGMRVNRRNGNPGCAIAKLYFFQVAIVAQRPFPLVVATLARITANFDTPPNIQAATHAQRTQTRPIRGPDTPSFCMLTHTPLT